MKQQQPQTNEPLTLSYAPQPNAARHRRRRVVLIVGASLACGLLVAMFVVPTHFMGSSGRARAALSSSAISPNGPIATALSLHRLHTRQFPSKLADLATQPPNQPNWAGPYLYASPAPADAWGSPFQYRCPGLNGRPYDLWSLGPDLISGTADDIKSW